MMKKMIIKKNNNNNNNIIGKKKFENSLLLPPPAWRMLWLRLRGKYMLRSPSAADAVKGAASDQWCNLLIIKGITYTLTREGRKLKTKFPVWALRTFQKKKKNSSVEKIREGQITPG